MADMFQVGAPTLREALKKLQAAGVIHIKHGAGIFVADNHDALFVHNPIAERKPSKKVILDMLEARLAVEPFTAGLAAENASGKQIERMGDLLDDARDAMTHGDYKTLAEASLGFHREISIASHNGVISQLLALITGLFQIELYTVLDIYGNTERDYREHRSILAAIAKRNRPLAVRRMRHHIANVRVAIERYYDEQGNETVE
jgi:GntR family transcriptional repressor for pyruvate dehydrogenase complex